MRRNNAFGVLAIYSTSLQRLFSLAKALASGRECCSEPPMMTPSSSGERRDLLVSFITLLNMSDAQINAARNLQTSKSHKQRSKGRSYSPTSSFLIAVLGGTPPMQ